MQFRIRHATPSDLPAIARVSASAFATHPVDSAVHCYLARYPSDWLRHEYYNISTFFYFPGVHAFVAESVDNNEIVGYAMWLRSGNSAVARKWRQRNISARFHLWRLLFAEKFFSYFDRAKDAKIEKYYYDSKDESVIPGKKDPGDDKRAEYWWLGLLAVESEMQGHRLGQRLTEWGVERAREEGVMLGVRCAVKLEPFYRKCGFGKVAFTSLKGESMEECQLWKMSP